MEESMNETITQLDGVALALLERGLMTGEIERPACFWQATRLGLPVATANSVSDKFIAIASNQTERRSTLRPRYDYVVVDAGASGSVIARRLAEKPEIQVLLLEAGGEDLTSSILITETWFMNLGTELDGNFAAKPSSTVNYRRIQQAPGKALGGGTSINANVWAHGHKNDFDHWAKEAGDDGWGYEHVLGIYRRIEDWQGAAAPKSRGKGGNVFVQPAPDPNPMAPAFLGTATSVGKAYVEALLSFGAAKVYAGARDPSKITDSRVIPVQLDVSSRSENNTAVRQCSDITLLVNNAGAMLNTPILAQDAVDAMRKEMEVNVFGMVSMIQRFAPILAKNGSGAIVNMLSVVSWFTSPFNATYAASKHAALAVSDAALIELHKQGTQVIGVYAGSIDTEMAAARSGPKTAPAQVAARALEGVESGLNHVLADERARQIYDAVRRDPEQLERTQQEAWDESIDPTDAHRYVLLAGTLALRRLEHRLQVAHQHLIQGVDRSRARRCLATCQGGQETYQGGEDNFGAPESVLLIEFGISRNQHLGEMVDEGLREKVLLVDGVLRKRSLCVQSSKCRMLPMKLDHDPGDLPDGLFQRR
jgi:choline dehydrogenase-like flavoprotein